METTMTGGPDNDRGKKVARTRDVGVSRAGDWFRAHCDCGRRSGKLLTLGNAVEWLRRHLAASGAGEDPDGLVRALNRAVAVHDGSDEFRAELLPAPMLEPPAMERVGGAPDAIQFARQMRAMWYQPAKPKPARKPRKPKLTDGGAA
jgi:hypothetical protein